MKKTNIWTLVVFVLICINSVVLVLIWKQKRPSPPMGAPIEVKDFLIKALSLTKSQVEQFETLRRAHHQAVENLDEKNHLLKDSLFKNLSNPATPTQIVNTLTSKIGYNSALIDKITFYHFKELRTILKPVQQEKFDKIIQQVIQMLARPMPENGRGPVQVLRPDGNGLPDMPPPNGNRPPGENPNRNGPPPERMPQGPPPEN